MNTKIGGVGASGEIGCRIPGRAQEAVTAGQARFATPGNRTNRGNEDVPDVTTARRPGNRREPTPLQRFLEAEYRFGQSLLREAADSLVGMLVLN